jgi:hypothetical protein
MKKHVARLAAGAILALAPLGLVNAPAEAATHGCTAVAGAAAWAWVSVIPPGAGAGGGSNAVCQYVSYSFTGQVHYDCFTASSCTFNLGSTNIVCTNACAGNVFVPWGTLVRVTAVTGAGQAYDLGSITCVPICQAINSLDG